MKKKHFVWGKEDIQMLRKEYQTTGPKILAERLGITAWSVTAKARRLGISATRDLPSDAFNKEENIQILKQNYVAKGGRFVAEMIGCPLDLVRKYASKLGLHTKAGYASAGKKRSEENTKFNIRYFQEWTPKMAYVLGFIYADGCISKNMSSLFINLQCDDRAVLEFIAKELDGDFKIREIPKRNGDRNSKAQVSLIVSSNAMIQDLMKIGVYPRKTYRNDPFPSIRNEYLPHFVRGFLDGDGCVSIAECGFCSVSFVGNPRFITAIRDILYQEAGMRCIPVGIRKSPTHTLATIQWSANKDVRLFRDYAYPEGHSFCLERKKAKLDEWFSQERPEYRTRKLWTEEEEKQVRDLYYVIGLNKLAEVLDRDHGVVWRKASELGIIDKTRSKLFI